MAAAHRALHCTAVDESVWHTIWSYLFIGRRRRRRREGSKHVRLHCNSLATCSPIFAPSASGNITDTVSYWCSYKYHFVHGTSNLLKCWVSNPIQTKQKDVNLTTETKTTNCMSNKYFVAVCNPPTYASQCGLFPIRISQPQPCSQPFQRGRQSGQVSKWRQSSWRSWWGKLSQVRSVAAMTLH